MLVPFDCPHCRGQIRGELTGARGETTCKHCGKSTPIPGVGIVPGVVLGNGFRLDRRIGDSMLGELYIGVQESMDRPVRIEVLTGMEAADEETFGRFQREVKLTASIDHPNLLGAIDAGVDCGNHFLVTHYRNGTTLDEYLRHNGPLDEQQAVALLLPIAAALSAAWEQRKLLHRNIKPKSILITEQQQPMLMDLGIAKSLEEDSTNLTAVGFTLGTPEYMSPEQCMAADDMDCRSDIYALGVVLYECVTGGPPFADASQVLLMQQHMNETPVPAHERRESVSTACSALIDWMLAKDRSNRPQSWPALIAAMENVAAGRDARSTGTSATAKGAKTAGKSRPTKAATGAGKGGARAKASEGLSRAQVEQIASQMYKTSPLTKMLLYGLSALIPIGIFVYLALPRNKGQAPAAETAAPAPSLTSAQSTGAAPVAPESGRLVTGPASSDLQEMFDYARQSAEEQPPRYDEAIRKLTVVRDQAAGTKYALMAQDEIDRLEQARNDALTAALKQIGVTVQAQIKAAEYDQAVAFLKDYDGPMAAATEAARRKTIERVRQRQATAKSQESARFAAMQTRLSDLRKAAAEAVLADDTTGAITLVTAAKTEPLLSAVQAEISDLDKLLRAWRRVDALILEQFQRDVGKVIYLETADGRHENEIKGINRGVLEVERIIRRDAGVGRVGFRLAAADLSLQERLKRLQQSEQPHRHHLCALLAWQAKDRKRAVQWSEAAGDEIAQAFLGAMQ